ncbi:MAG: alpha-L-fucosidase [Victivallaceae bacterium]|nr:alpha-L-fucosidase [Victivallaceae bacterium]
MRYCFDGKKYGFFFHFLNNGDPTLPEEARGQEHPMPPEMWERYVAGFDVEKIAGQLAEINAGYAFLTTGQNSGYYCTPSRVYDREVGKGFCSQRDLIADFADALARHGIDAGAYVTTLAPGKPHEIIRKLHCTPAWPAKEWELQYNDLDSPGKNDPRLEHFQTIWNEMQQEWSLRWGKKIKAWWCDGAYYSEYMYDFPDGINGHTRCRALRAGNPDAAVALNGGVDNPPHRNYTDSDEDYLAGEINEPQELVFPTDPRDTALKLHILTYAGTEWGAAPLRFTGREMAEITRRIFAHGGVTTWDIPFTLQGIADDVMDVLRDFKREFEKNN